MCKKNFTLLIPPMIEMPLYPTILSNQLHLLNNFSASKVTPRSLDRLCMMIWGSANTVTADLW